MSFVDFMSKVRYWDNQVSKWMVRHFYILFFEILLVAIFVTLFVVSLKVIDTSVMVSGESTIERLLFLQSVNSIIIVLLMLLNSFWMLYLFNGIIRIRGLLRDINFNILKKKN